MSDELIVMQGNPFVATALFKANGQRGPVREVGPCHPS
jgi:hypothetical protein